MRYYALFMLLLLAQLVRSAPAEQKLLIPDSKSLKTIASSHLQEDRGREDLVIYKDSHGYVYATFDLVHQMKIYDDHDKDLVIGETVLMSTQYFNLTQGALDLEKHMMRTKLSQHDEHYAFKQRNRLLSVGVKPVQTFVRSAYSSRIDPLAHSASSSEGIDMGHDHGFRHDEQMSSYTVMSVARYGMVRGVHKLILKGDIVDLDQGRIVSHFEATGDIPVDPLDFHANMSLWGVWKDRAAKLLDSVPRPKLNEDALLGLSVLVFLMCTAYAIRDVQRSKVHEDEREKKAKLVRELFAKS